MKKNNIIKNEILIFNMFKYFLNSSKIISNLLYISVFINLFIKSIFLINMGFDPSIYIMPMMSINDMLNPDNTSTDNTNQAEDNEGNATYTDNNNTTITDNNPSIEPSQNNATTSQTRPGRFSWGFTKPIVNVDGRGWRFSVSRGTYIIEGQDFSNKPDRVRYQIRLAAALEDYKKKNHLTGTNKVNLSIVRDKFSAFDREYLNRYVNDNRISLKTAIIRLRRGEEN